MVKVVCSQAKNIDLIRKLQGLNCKIVTQSGKKAIDIYLDEPNETLAMEFKKRLNAYDIRFLLPSQNRRCEKIHKREPNLLA